VKRKGKGISKANQSTTGKGIEEYAIGHSGSHLEHQSDKALFCLVDPSFVTPHFEREAGMGSKLSSCSKKHLADERIRVWL